MVIKRITIARLDVDNGSVELEVVPLNADIDPEEFARTEYTHEDLAWWDASLAETEPKTLAEFKSQIGISFDSPLAEGMVFWASFEGETMTAVQHVTHMARQYSKELYDRLTNGT